ncbi:MAG: YeeE/YedE family protein [Methylococcales bacterium]|nr:YeeE/YedE family protein [Methylococcales bacterium]
MENFTPISSILGGMLIGISIAILLFFNGRMAGISSIMNGLLNSPKNEMFWRLTFLIGLILGAFIFQALTEKTITPSHPHSLWLMSIGGFLVGIGTRLGSGCTSGHGICGIANLSKRSIYATLTFMSAGVITVYFIKHIQGLA